MSKPIDFKAAYYTATKWELYGMARDAFAQRGIPVDKLDEAIYRCSLKMKKMERERIRAQKRSDAAALATPQHVDHV